MIQTIEFQTIELYLIRHGLAGDRTAASNDNERPLTEDGIRRTKRVARRLHDLEIRFDGILTSPLVRSRQTAELLKSAGLCKSLEESAHLAPEGELEGWLDWLQKWRQLGGTRLALVGHEPNLSAWAERLIWGEPRQQLILKKAGIIGLLLPQHGSPVGHSELFWLTPPRLLLDE